MTLSDKSKKSEGSKSASTSIPPTARRSRKLFCFLAVVLGVAPFVALEAALRLFSIGEDAATTDLHSGFGVAAPLFVLDEDGENYTTGLGREQFFVTQSFEARKPDNQFRIFCLGGSTVQGRPYLPDTAFGKWLELELNAMDNYKEHKVINCGGISYASYRLRPLVEEIINYEPDLILVATGHNEFLEDKTYSEVKTRSSTRIWIENSAKSLRSVMLLRKLVGGAARIEPTTETKVSSESLDTRLDDPSGYASYHRDGKWHEYVCGQFERSVNSIVDTCQSARVPLALVQLGANLRDCPPFKSEHREGLTVEDEQRWQEIFDAASLADDSNPETGLELYLQALQIDVKYPLLHFRIARCYDALGQFENARQHYQNALDLDVCPLRKCSRLGKILVDIATRKSVTLVDAESAISEFSPESICGYESYIDHVHPTIAAHQTIAQQIVAGVPELRPIPGSTQLTTQQRRHLYRDYLKTQLPPSYYSNGRRRIGWLEGWAQRTRLADETVPVDTRGRVALIIRNIDLHRFIDAELNISEAVAADIHAVAQLTTAALSLFRQGRNLEASWLLSELEGLSMQTSLKKSVMLGKLVMACDAGDCEAVTKYESAYVEEWGSILAADESGWADVIQNLPEVIQTMQQ